MDIPDAPPTSDRSWRRLSVPEDCFRDLPALAGGSFSTAGSPGRMQPPGSPGPPHKRLSSDVRPGRAFGSVRASFDGVGPSFVGGSEDLTAGRVGV